MTSLKAKYRHFGGEWAAALPADARYWIGGRCTGGGGGFGTGSVGKAAAGSSLSSKVRPQLLVWKGVQGLGGVAQTNCDCLKSRGQTSAKLILNVKGSKERLFFYWIHFAMSQMGKNKDE